MDTIRKINQLGGKVYYGDTDSFHTDIELPSEMIDSSVLGKLKFEGSYDKSYYLGKNLAYLKDTKTMVSKTISKGFREGKIKEEDWEKASKGEIVLIEDFSFKKVDHLELIEVNRYKKLKLSLIGRKFNSDGTSEPFEINSLSQSLENSIKASLENTELDVQDIRVKTAHNSKIPVKKGWTKIVEEEDIKERLSDRRILNYSLKTGEVLGKDIHLIVVDIDLKTGKTYEYISNRLLDVFRGYYIVKTPNLGYHIYLKVKSSEKFKSQYLRTLEGNTTTIEIMGVKMLEY